MPSPEVPSPEVPGADEATKVCPYCAEVIKAAAIKCRYCQSDLSGLPDEPAASPAPPHRAEPATVAPAPIVAPVVPTKPAPTAPDDEDSEPEEAVRRRGWGLLATGVAIVLVLVFLTLAFLDWRSAREIDAGDSAARTVRAAVTDKVEALLGYSYKTFDDDFDAAKKTMTSDFEKEYEPTVAEIRDRALAQKRSQTADVVAVAVVSQSPEKVETLVFVNTISTREGTDRQRLMQNRVNVTLVKQDGEWLVSELSVPQS